MRDGLNDLAARYCRLRDELERDRLEERILKEVQPLLEFRCRQFNLSEEEREDLLQSLRITTVLALRQWNPDKNARFSAYLCSALQYAQITFLAWNSRLSPTVERMLANDELDESRASAARAIRSPTYLDNGLELHDNTDIWDLIHQEERELFFAKVREALYSNISDRRLAEVLLFLHEGRSKREMRHLLHCSWSELTRLIDTALQMMQDWQTQPPDWLVQLYEQFVQLERR